MSLSLREELRVVLSPDQVLLVRVGRQFTRRGLIRRVLDKKAVSCAGSSGSEAPWSAAIKTLATELPGLANNATVAVAILSSHFVRYALVPWSAALKDDEEEAAFARHFFRQLYGAIADSWELRLSPDRPGAPQLASAVDPGLPEAVRALSAEAGISVRSIQPSLMTAYNNSRLRLQGYSGWFVLHETGSLCLALMQQGRWISVRTFRAGDDWRETLPLLLEREAFLLEQEAETNDVFVWAPALDKGAMPESGSWKFQQLQPVIHPDFVDEYEGRFAMAMGG